MLSGIRTCRLMTMSTGLRTTEPRLAAPAARCPCTCMYLLLPHDRPNGNKITAKWIPGGQVSTCWRGVLNVGGLGHHLGSIGTLLGQPWAPFGFHWDTVGLHLANLGGLGDEILDPLGCLAAKSLKNQQQEPLKRDALPRIFEFVWKPATCVWTAQA